MRLSDLHTGECAIIVRHHTTGVFRKRLLEMGFIVGREILVVKSAPLLDPVEYRILGYDVSLRREEAETIEVNPLSDKRVVKQLIDQAIAIEEEGAFSSAVKRAKEKLIRVALVGNPNCGKTSLYNKASGSNEHVGNYAGVTVEARRGLYRQGGYTFELIDLPGTYSLSSYSPEERYVADYLLGVEQPDVIVNVVDSTNLERNLYMTVQLIEMGLPTCVALNMYDELKRSKSTLDVEMLSRLIGVPLTPTVARIGEGLSELFEQVIRIHENRSHVRRMIDVRYQEPVEELISDLKGWIDKYRSELTPSMRAVRPRYLALKLLTGDEQVSGELTLQTKHGAFLVSRAKALAKQYDERQDKDLVHVITDTRYGFLNGALQETFVADFSSIVDKSRKIDALLTSKVWGLPIFVFLMYVMFQATFSLGAYPMEWIETGVARVGDFIGRTMPAGSLRDLIVDGVIAGVGGVIVFLPNIVILYFFISLLEDTGYMARAAFIMDRLMHLIGLHGKSFIPMVMGFGCNVPAIMATRMIESRNNRILTMLILPFMSCSARLPVYLLLAGAFFPTHAGLVLFALYFLGILIAAGSSLLFKRLLMRHEDLPFVMELPPYRLPTPKSVLLQMWDKSKQYLLKMGSVILLASVLIWALGYFPHYTQEELEELAGRSLTHREVVVEQQEHSIIGTIGKALEPVFRPLGYDWRLGIALITGTSAKEIVVSTMGVLFAGGEEDGVVLEKSLKSATHRDGTPLFTPPVALSFMAFVLIYFPCIATIVAIGRESGSWRYALFSALYTCLLAWVVALAITRIGTLFF